MPEQVCTGWREVTPTREATILGLKRATVVLGFCILAIALQILDGVWLLLPILAGAAALLSIAFDLDRLRRRPQILERYQFDDARFEVVYKAHVLEAPSPTVLAYDALERLLIKKCTIGFYVRGNDLPEEVVSPEHFPNRATLDDLLHRAQSRGVLIEYKDDSLDTVIFGRLPHRS
jgi:hypothetical protein